MSGNSDDYKKFIAEKDKTVDPDVSVDDIDAAAIDRAGEKKSAPPKADMELGLFDGVRTSGGSPVQPVRLTGKDTFCFSCHKGVSCWNECCHNTDITLTPFDILRLSEHLNIRPAEFLTRFALPAIPTAPRCRCRSCMADEEGRRPALRVPA
ncbi:MAG: hypothetical protein R3D02_10825 [Hyphomicrobiales bacterium]